MDDFMLRIVFLIVGLMIGYVAGAATSAAKYARIAKNEIHECRKILMAIKDKVVDDDE